MTEQMENYTKEYEQGVAEIKKRIEEAKNKLNSGNFNNPVIKDAYERAVLFQENQLQMAINNHKFILELNGMGE